MKKENKTTVISFDEASPLIEIQTHNAALRRRLKEYHVKYPNLCKLLDDDPENCYTVFAIDKKRFSFRLTSPYTEERREQAKQSVMIHARPAQDHIIYNESASTTDEKKKG